MFFVVAAANFRWGANTDLTAAKRKAQTRGVDHLIYTFNDSDDFIGINDMGYIHWKKECPPVSVELVENGKKRTLAREDW